MADKNNKNGFTMISDYLLWKYDDLVLAAVYGKIERFTKLGGNRICKATNQTLADELSLSEGAIWKKKQFLLKEGYLTDNSKKSLRNKPHTLAITDKLDTEEQLFWEYAEQKRNSQKDNGEDLYSYFDCFREYAIENELEPFYSKSKKVKTPRKNKKEKLPNKHEEIPGDIEPCYHKFPSSPGDDQVNPSDDEVNPSDDEVNPSTNDNTNNTNKTNNTIFQENSKEQNFLGESDSLFSEDVPSVLENNISILESENTSAASDGKPSSQLEDPLKDGSALDTRNQEDCSLFEQDLIPPDSEDEKIFLAKWESKSWPDLELKFWFNKLMKYIYTLNKDFLDELVKKYSIREFIQFIGKIYFPGDFCEDPSKLE